MLVRHRMTQNPLTVTPHDTLATAREMMTRRHCRHLPVIEGTAVVGMLTESDLRRHEGVEERTRVVAAMSENPLTIPPSAPVEEAVHLMLKHKIGGIPVLEDEKLVGILTTSDVLHAFLDITGGAAEESVRIDLLQSEKSGDLMAASQLIANIGGEVLGVGTYRDPWSGQPLFYLRIRGVGTGKATQALQEQGYSVLSVH